MINNRHKISCTIAVTVLLFGSHQVFGQDKNLCANPSACIGMVIDSGDPVLIQMGHEMSDMVTDKQAGVMVKPTAGPIANVARLMSRENAGLSVVPSDMLQFTARSKDPQLRKAKDHLRFIMTIGQKVVHVIARTSISRLEDLDGKRVVMGPDNTALWVVSNNLLHLHGVTPSERIQLKPAAGIAAVLLDQADAAFVVGGAPMGVIQKLGAMRQSEELGPDTEQVHMLELKLPASATEYKPVTVNYPGFAENLDTVAILPTLVSYDFSQKSSPYFRHRCGELARIGEMVRSRLEELRATGHKQWRATTWEMKAGNWQKDSCFFGTAKQQIAGDKNSDGKALSPPAPADNRTKINPLLAPTVMLKPRLKKMTSAALPHELTSKASSTRWAIQLASVRDPNEAKVEWRRLLVRFKDILEGKKLAIIRAHLGERGIFYRLRIGGFQHKDSATMTCASIKMKGGNCLVILIPQLNTE